jgi:hypothetical protein
MASIGVDKNRLLTELNPATGAVSDENRLDPGDLIAMSAVTSRMGALMLGSATGSFRVLEAMRRVAAALGIDHL